MRRSQLNFAVRFFLIAMTSFFVITPARNGLVIAQGKQEEPQVVTDGVAGRWTSIFDYGGMRLHLILKMSKSPDGSYSGTVDSPDQGAADLKIDSIVYGGTGFKFSMGAIGASYDGFVNGERDEIVGNWKQGPLSVPMVFRREGAKAHAAFKRGSVLLEPCNLAKLSSDAHCGKYEVFEDRTSKSGRKIALNLLVFSAKSDKPQADAVLFLAGGPGQGAVSVVDDGGDFLADIRRDRDIVFVDQRGTGESNQLNCNFFKDFNDMTPFFGDPFIPDRVRQCKSELEKKANLALYTTQIAMDDLDEVRAALGYDRINVLGGSYGTNAALAYVRQHQEHVRTVVLMGVAPMEYKLPLPFAKGVQHAADRLFEDCAADVTCQKTFPNLKTEFNEVLARLEKAPATFQVINAITNAPQQITLTRTAFVEGLRILLYSPDVSSLLPLLIHQAHENDYTAFAEYTFLLVRQIGSKLATGMQLSILCSEHVPFVTEGEIKRETEGTYYGDHRVREMQKTCKEWPVSKVPDAFKNPVRSDRPTLLISGEIDPVTPPSVSIEAAKLLTNSRQVVIKNGSHLTESPCITKLMADFISKGSADGLDSTCVDQIKRPPFVYTLPRSFKP
jgi:pimeloyl-ACP methyl ester carboxylesterase